MIKTGYYSPHKALNVTKNKKKNERKIIKIVQITNNKTQLPGQQAYVIVFFFPGIPVIK